MILSNVFTRLSALALSLTLLAAPAQAQPELTDPVLPTLDPGDYVDAELLWTFDSLDTPAILEYLTTQPDGPNVRIIAVYSFPEVARTIVHSTTPPCREVFQSIGFGPAGLPGFFNAETNESCPPINIPFGALPPNAVLAVEPNVLVEQCGPGTIPNDPSFPIQWPLDNRGIVVGYTFVDADNDGQYSGGESVYADLNGNLKVDATDRLFRGPAAPVNTVLKNFPADVAFKTWNIGGGMSVIVIYKDADNNKLVSVGDVRLSALNAPFVGAAGAVAADGSVVAAADRDATPAAAARGFIFQDKGTIDADIDAPKAWTHNTDCAGFVIAVMDSGIDLPNADLSPNLWVKGGAGPNQNGASFLSAETHDESVNANRLYDSGEGIYLDTDGSKTITVGDIRVTPAAASGLAAGAVAAGDADIMGVLVDFYCGTSRERFVDANGNGTYQANEPIYNDRDSSGTVTDGDRLLRGAPVALNTALVAFPANTAHADPATPPAPGNMLYDPGETIYLDANTNLSVDVGDTRLTVSGALLPGAVVAGDADIGTALVAFSARTFICERHIDNGAGANVYDAGEPIYVDRDNTSTVSVNDGRRTSSGPWGPAPNVTYATNTLVVAGNRDIAQALVPFRNSILGDALQDTNGHGTWCSSVIGARGNNNRGLAGVCWTARIMTLRIVGSDRNHTMDRAIAAAKWALDRINNDGVDLRIVNYSHGRGGTPLVAELSFLEAFNRRKVLYVVAAGNQGFDIDPSPVSGFSPVYPAGYSVAPPVPNLITVGGSDRFDRRTLNFGRVAVHIAAPARDVPVLSVGGNGDIQYVTGTSFAAPHVAGIAAQAISLFPGLYAAANGHIAIKNKILDVNSIDERSGLSGSSATGKQGSARARMLQGAEFGDAPDPMYPSLLASNGARHEDSGEEWLGRAADLPARWFDPPVLNIPAKASNASPEFDAQNSGANPADPDGLANLINKDAHDDGVEFLTPFVFSKPGFARSVKLRVFVDTRNNGRSDSDADGGRYAGSIGPGSPLHPSPGVHAATDAKFIFVNVWADWNRNGSWTDASEHILLLRIQPDQWLPAVGPAPSTGAVYTLTVPMPAKPANATAGDTYLRVRLDYGENAGQRLPLVNEMFFTNFFNPLTAPGALYRDWTFTNGLPLPMAVGQVPATLFETPDMRPPAVNGVTGVAQFGEVEDYLIKTRERCPADVNADDVVSIQDIFDFLVGWFGVVDPGDVNGDMVINLQDIFDFLAAWFAGC